MASSSSRVQARSAKTRFLVIEMMFTFMSVLLFVMSIFIFLASLSTEVEVIIREDEDGRRVKKLVEK
jgi:hypothetical protein